MKASLSLFLMLLPLAACAPATDLPKDRLVKVTVTPENFAFSPNLTSIEEGLAISVNGNNVTTWTNECKSETKKLSEVDESVQKSIESLVGGLTTEKNFWNSYVNRAIIDKFTVKTVTYGFRSDDASGIFPVQYDSPPVDPISIVGIAVVNDLVAFIQKSGNVELIPSKCLNESQRGLIQSSRDFQSLFGPRRLN